MASAGSSLFRARVPFDGNAKDAAILHTCLALASASVDCGENSNVPLRACRTETATGLAVQLLVGIAQTAHRMASCVDFLWMLSSFCNKIAR
jgi:hypothetical protein